jgi:hypothetical protein
MRIRLLARLRAWVENDFGVTKSAVVILAALLVLGSAMVFALSNYGGEIGLITREEPRLAYLYCREEIKNKLNLSDNSLFDNYLDATIYTIQAHQYMVRLRFDVESAPNTQVDAYLPCTISAQANGTWKISELNFTP